MPAAEVGRHLGRSRQVMKGIIERGERLLAEEPILRARLTG
jgi:hypothetical protein